MMNTIKEVSNHWILFNEFSIADMSNKD
jgi:hypothetical protein